MSFHPEMKLRDKLYRGVAGHLCMNGNLTVGIAEEHLDLGRREGTKGQDRSEGIKCRYRN